MEGFSSNCQVNILGFKFITIAITAILVVRWMGLDQYCPPERYITWVDREETAKWDEPPLPYAPEINFQCSWKPLI